MRPPRFFGLAPVRADGGNVTATGVNTTTTTQTSTSTAAPSPTLRHSISPLSLGDPLCDKVATVDIPSPSAHRRGESTPTAAYSSHSHASSWTWNVDDDAIAASAGIVVVPHPTPPATDNDHDNDKLQYRTSTIKTGDSEATTVAPPRGILPGMAAIDPNWTPNPDLVPARKVGHGIRRGRGPPAIRFADMPTLKSFMGVGSILNRSPSPDLGFAHKTSMFGTIVAAGTRARPRITSRPPHPSITTRAALCRHAGPAGGHDVGCPMCTAATVGLARVFTPRYPPPPASDSGASANTDDDPTPTGSTKTECSSASSTTAGYSDTSAPVIQWSRTCTNGEGRIDMPPYAVPQLDDLLYPPTLCLTGHAPLKQQYTVAWARIAFLSHLQDWVAGAFARERDALTRYPLPHDVVGLLHLANANFWSVYLERVDADLAEAVQAMHDVEAAGGAFGGPASFAHSFRRKRAKRAGLAAAARVVADASVVCGSPWVREGMYCVVYLPEDDVELLVEEGEVPLARRRYDGEAVVWVDLGGGVGAGEWVSLPPWRAGESVTRRNSGKMERKRSWWRSRTM